MLGAAHRGRDVHRLVPRIVPFTTAQARYQREVMRDSPRAFYPFQDASGNPVDVSGNGLDMTTITGTPDYHQPGPLGDDYSIFVGASEQISRSTQVSTVQNNFTIEAWVKITTVSATDLILINNGNAASNGWGIRMNDGNTFLGLAGGVAEQSGKGFVLNAWTHLVVQRDGGDANRWKYYTNGVINLANAGNTNPGAPSGTLQVGANSASFSCYFAYVAIYESALSAARVLAHFNAAGLRGTP